MKSTGIFCWILSLWQHQGIFRYASMAHRKHSYILIITALLLSTTFASAQAKTPKQRVIRAFAQATVPKHEVRAVWLTTLKNLDWPKTLAKTESSMREQQEELKTILDSLKKANINTILLQTRVRATTIYPSAYEPWDWAFTGTAGQSPDYDVLQFAINECHKRGMELHAWIVTIPIGKWNSFGCQQLRKKYPKMIKKVKDEGYIDPGHPQSAEYVASICREITEKYDIDGIHLDYIRYPESWRISEREQDNARSNITRIVRRISENVKEVKPWVKMSCSPIGKYRDLDRQSSYGWNAYNKGGQDAQRWLKEGYMDMLFPMMYFDGRHYYPFLMDWQENNHGRVVCAGLGTYQLSENERDWDSDVIERQINVARSVGMGHSHFCSRFFTDDHKDIYQLTTNLLNLYPALVPPMTWACNDTPEPPTTLTLRKLIAGDELTWDYTEGAQTKFNVYASPIFPVDVNDPSLLIATYLTSRTISIPDIKEDFYYAVTAINRYGFESLPVSTKPEEDFTGIQSTLINDGVTLFIPTDNRMFDADYMIVETLQGMIVATKQYHNNKINIADIPEGMYVIKSLGKKGKTHRLGFFTVRRHNKHP